jgi:hypothetical protein
MMSVGDDEIHVSNDAFIDEQPTLLNLQKLPKSGFKGASNPHQRRADVSENDDWSGKNVNSKTQVACHE